MSEDRAPATSEEVADAIRAIRAYHDQGRQSLRELPQRGKHGARAIDEQAERLGWNPTRLRKARQFAHREEGYSRDRLNELCRLLREHRPVFGISHVGLLVTVPWPEREAIQRECLEGNWSTYELQAEIKRRYGTRRQGGRRRRVSSDPDHALVQLDEMADTWQRWFAVAGEGEEGTILDALPEKVRTRAKAVQSAVSRLRDAVSAELEASREKSAAGLKSRGFQKVDLRTLTLRRLPPGRTPGKLPLPAQPAPLLLDRSWAGQEKSLDGPARRRSDAMSVPIKVYSDFV